MSADAVSISTPMIMDVRAAVVSGIEPHVLWSIGYAPELDEEGGRFLLGSLHATGNGGFVEVTVAATQWGGDFGDLADDEQIQEFEAAVEDATAFDLLYDIARITARTLSGTIDCDLDLPLAPPFPELSALVRRSEGVTPAAASPEEDLA